MSRAETSAELAEGGVDRALLLFPSWELLLSPSLILVSVLQELCPYLVAFTALS